MDQDVIALYVKARNAYTELLSCVVSLKKQQKEAASDMHEMADIAYVLREAHKLIDGLAHELARAQDVCVKLACLLWTRDSDGGPIRTEYCTATPQIKMTAAIPKKKSNPEQYAQLMNFLGVPEPLWNGENDVVRVHWPGFVEYTTNLESEGRQLPPGIDPDKAYEVYRLRIIKRKNVDE